MLRRSVSRLCGFGIPAQAEPKDVQKDAFQYVKNSEYEFISRPEDELTWVMPKGWMMSSPHGRQTLQTGETVTEYMCHPVDTNQSNIISLNVNHCMGVLTTEFAPHAEKRPIRADMFFEAWIKQYELMVLQTGNHTDFRYTKAFPCTPLNDEPAHGVYAYSLAKQKAAGTDTGVYYRLFFHDDWSRFTVVTYQAAREVFERHLAHRWYGLNLLESVRNVNDGEASGPIL
eukprot:TRINITY_DN30026_c0_g1_i1.p1 TRINITY_DN30026_c0_g1~~TRINITY_DN30026_c0_g1_i1.p1  ORF type:complete len:249 (+),score=73.20 TRINITY_DN30026_c0_g1_i1:61-747(+)